MTPRCPQPWTRPGDMPPRALVLPAIREGDDSALPCARGSHYQAAPNAGGARGWFAGPARRDLCLVCGRVSGNLEMIDFDLAGVAFEPWRAGSRRCARAYRSPCRRDHTLGRSPCRIPVFGPGLRQHETRATVPRRTRADPIEVAGNVFTDRGKVSMAAGVRSPR